jgi:hypothetical protein
MFIETTGAAFASLIKTFKPFSRVKTEALPAKSVQETEINKRNKKVRYCDLFVLATL